MERPDVEDRQGAVQLGRYMIRSPIVLKRLSWETETCEGLPQMRLYEFRRRPRILKQQENTPCAVSWPRHGPRPRTAEKEISAPPGLGKSG